MRFCPLSFAPPPFGVLWTNVQNGSIFFFDSLLFFVSPFELKTPNFQRKPWGTILTTLKSAKMEMCKTCEKVLKRLCPLVVAL